MSSVARDSFSGDPLAAADAEAWAADVEGAKGGGADGLGCSGGPGSVRANGGGDDGAPNGEGVKGEAVAGVEGPGWAPAAAGKLKGEGLPATAGVGELTNTEFIKDSLFAGSGAGLDGSAA